MIVKNTKPPKPIFVIRLPIKNTWDENEKLQKQAKNTCKQLGINDDYHVLIIFDEISKSMEFECYNTNKKQTVKIKDLEERLAMMMESAINKF